MKIFLILFILILLSGCKSNQNTSEQSGAYLKEISCPDSGNCEFEVLENSVLNVRTDEFGKLYPEVIPGNKVVIKFHYKKTVPENVMDANYSEYIYLEVNEYEPQLILRDKELQKVKMLFGRICFCRGAMGYFKVTKGSLYLFNIKGKLKMDLTFEVDKIPQIISEVKEEINY